MKRERNRRPAECFSEMKVSHFLLKVTAADTDPSLRMAAGIIQQLLGRESQAGDRMICMSAG